MMFQVHISPWCHVNIIKSSKDIIHCSARGELHGSDLIKQH